ncbi:MAG: DUF3575 domain-containing protein [Bacteroidia bacterium]|nr:DUF3575 domain-containing protein [Bacteroidia bacterium]
MKKVILFFSILFTLSSLNAQEANTQQSWDMSEGAMFDGKTIVKANMLGWATRNFGFYGERIINKNISAVLGINFMPKGGVPYISKFSTDPLIKDIRVSSFSLTPEMRIYLSKSGYGRGFYIAPYYKYERYNAHEYTLSYKDENDANQSLLLNGSLNTHSFGAALGVQWLLGKNKNIALDWTILGAHYGVNYGSFNGLSSYTLSAAEQADIKKELESSIGDVKINDTQILKLQSVDVDANSAQAKIKSPWAFIRASLSIGYRF